MREKPYTVWYRAIDGARGMRCYKTFKGARAFAIERVGENPEIGSTYAVSSDGIVTVEVEGCTLAELFAKPEAPAAKPADEAFWIVAGMQFATREAAWAESRSLFLQGCGERRNPTDEFISAYRVEGPYLLSELFGSDEP